MSKEQFRLRVARGNGETTEDNIVDLCVELQLYFFELDHQKILKMPIGVFLLLVDNLFEKAKKAQRPSRNSSQVMTFG